VELKNSPKLFPACVLKVEEGMEVITRSDRLLHYRQTILELLFAERNHVCSVCVVNNHCELQSLAQTEGVTHVRLPYRNPKLSVDASHERFVADQNRCILCTRCVRVCSEIEGAHVWDVMGRGIDSLVITDLMQPWGESTCTRCGKCVTCAQPERFSTRARSVLPIRSIRTLCPTQHDARKTMSKIKTGNGLAGWLLGLPHVLSRYGRAASGTLESIRAGL